MGSLDLGSSLCGVAGSHPFSKEAKGWFHASLVCLDFFFFNEKILNFLFYFTDVVQQK